MAASLDEGWRRVKRNPSPPLCYNPRVSTRPLASPARWLIVAAWGLAFAVSARAQQPAEPATSKASDGVYTAEQAERGKDVFASLCTGCHTVATQSGATFAKKWNGVRLSELYVVLAEQMPKDDPGALTLKERIDVIAYLLKLNELPAGKDALSADPELLKKIVIDLKGAGA